MWGSAINKGNNTSFTYTLHNAKIEDGGIVADVDPWDDMVDGITFNMGDNDSFADSFAGDKTPNKGLSQCRLFYRYHS